MKKLIFLCFSFSIVAILGTMMIRFAQERALSDPATQATLKALSQCCEDFPTCDCEDLVKQCYDRYASEATWPWTPLERFRACDETNCGHIWAYSPKQRTVCSSKK